MSDYHDLLQRLGRVTVNPSHAVSLDVAAQIATRARWLRHTLIPELDGVLGVTFPFIVLHRAVWIGELADRTLRIVKGRVGPFALSDGRGIWAIELSAVTILEYPKDLLTGVLAHEFLHYVWLSFASANQGDTDLDFTEDEHRDIADYKTRDKQRAVEAERWLSPSLQVLCRRAESGGPEIDAIHGRFETTWASRIPWVRAERDYHFNGQWVIDEALISKAGLDRM